MSNYSFPCLKRFVEFSTFTTKPERKKICSIIERWEHLPLEQSNISKNYLTTINSFIADRKINAFIKLQPNSKEQFVKQLLELLVETDEAITNKPDFADEEELIKSFYSKSIDEEIEVSELEESQFYNSKTVKRLIDRELEIEQAPDIERKKRLKTLQAKMVKHWKSLFNKKHKQSKTSVFADKLKLAVNNSPKEKEEKLIADFEAYNLEKFQQKMEGLNYYKRFLKEQYPKDFVVKNYERQYQNILNKQIPVNQDSIKKERQLFYANWQEQLDIEKLSQNIKIINEKRKEALEILYKKIEELKALLELLAPFISDSTNFGRLWDLSVGDLRTTDLSILQDYAKILERKDDIIELANVLGRFRFAESQYEQEEFEKSKSVNTNRIDVSGKSELIGVKESDDLNYVLPTEIALFSDPSTEDIFYNRLAEKKLQTFQLIDTVNESLTIKEKGLRDKEIKKDKGPMIIAVDTSGSMRGEPESLAKVIAFAITKIATKENRKAFLITFSTRIKTFELTNFESSITELISFLQESFSGGTDPDIAVNEAVRKMESEKYEDADLLIITDGVFYGIDKDTNKHIKALKKSGNKFNTLIIGNSQNTKALDFCDNVWCYNSRTSNISELIEIIKVMQ